MESQWDIREGLGSEAFPRNIVSPLDGAEMVLVPQGPFVMGIGEEELQRVVMLDQRQNPIFATELPASVTFSIRSRNTSSVRVVLFLLSDFSGQGFSYWKFLIYSLISL